MCCLTICATCNLDHLRYLVTNLYFPTLRRTFPQGSILLTLLLLSMSMVLNLSFKGYDALNEFCLFLFSMEHKGFIAIAHNAKDFDAILIQRWLIENRPTADMNVIHSGQKIMQFWIGFKMPLSNFPKTFGLDLSLYSKGDFLSKFNTFDNWNYVGQIPDIEHFSPDTWFEKSRSELFVWHNDLRQNNYIFDFQKEMCKYCAQDVTILRLCCLRFRDLFLSETKVDPFCHCTIAASVMAVYHANYLKKETIAIVPPKHVPKWKRALLHLLICCRPRQIQWLGTLWVAVGRRKLWTPGWENIISIGFVRWRIVYTNFMVVCFMVVLYVLTVRTITCSIADGRCVWWNDTTGMWRWFGNTTLGNLRKRTRCNMFWTH